VTISELTEEAVELTALAADLNDQQSAAYEEAALAAQQAWERLEAAEQGEPK
jgi:hypothetical protein